MITDAEVEAVRQRSCVRKAPFSPSTADDVVAELRARGDQVQKYRCSWCGHWHVGHVMSMQSLETLAAIIRYRQAGPPVDHPQPKQETTL